MQQDMLPVMQDTPGFLRMSAMVPSDTDSPICGTLISKLSREARDVTMLRSAKLGKLGSPSDARAWEKDQLRMYFKQLPQLEVSLPVFVWVASPRSILLARLDPGFAHAILLRKRSDAHVLTNDSQIVGGGELRGRGGAGRNVIVAPTVRQNSGASAHGNLISLLSKRTVYQ